MMLHYRRCRVHQIQYAQQTKKISGRTNTLFSVYFQHSLSSGSRPPRDMVQIDDIVSLQQISAVASGGRLRVLEAFRNARTRDRFYLLAGRGDLVSVRIRLRDGHGPLKPWLAHRFFPVSKRSLLLCLQVYTVTMTPYFQNSSHPCVVFWNIL